MFQGAVSGEPGCERRRCASSEVSPTNQVSSVDTTQNIPVTDNPQVISKTQNLGKNSFEENHLIPQLRVKQSNVPEKYISPSHVFAVRTQCRVQ